MSLTPETILQTLKAIQDPDLHKDIVTLGFVKDVKIQGGSVDLTIELTTPACPVKDQMKAQAEALVGALPGVSSVMVNMTAQVRARGGMTSQAIPGIRNVIAVGAGKGGVGKSTNTVNLAIALAKKGARVGVMDADVYGPNLPQMLGIEMEPGAIELTEDQKMIPPMAHAVKGLSIGMLVPKDQAVIWRGPMLHSAVQQFMRDVAWGELDYLLVDLPPEELSQRFSAPIDGDEKFGNLPVAEAVNGIPILNRILAQFECVLDRTIQVGTHVVMFGKVVGTESHPDPAWPLLYYHREYHRLNRPE